MKNNSCWVRWKHLLASIFGACALIFFATFWYVDRNETGRDRMSNKPVSSPSRFKLMADGAEILDVESGLIWRRCAEGMNWNGRSCIGRHTEFPLIEALQHADQEARRTGNTWRVPGKDELHGIVDKSRIEPSIDPVAFPDTPVRPFWSSSVDANNFSSAWSVHFSLGFARNLKRENPVAVRLVRSSQRSNPEYVPDS